MPADALPIDAILPALVAALGPGGQAVLQAPPGAGKTTRVPLALLEAGRFDGKLLMLEPRRVAARAAAERMAATLGEPVGRTVGYRIRGEAKTGPATRIEVVTEGILTRMLQDAPDLPGVGAVVFDEFHERALTADLGLALALDARAGLRPDLVLMVMSATLDAGPVAALMGGAPVLTSEGRAFPVETRWLDAPRGPRADLVADTAALIRQALAETTGGLLAFLPGEGEIRRLAATLAPGLPPGTVLQPLYGAMPLAEQRAVLSPLPEGRKLVLATAIAETSLTIPDIRVVVDAGRARRLRFDPASGMSRLVTERVSRAEAEQRRGRAGRVAPGTCYRLWTRGEEGALPEAAPPEIERADLAGLALDLADWGAAAEALPFLTPPPGPALAEAQALCRDLGALDDAGRITPHGRALARLPLHPRLGHMLTRAGKPAARLAALIAARPLPAESADLAARLRLLDAPPPPLKAAAAAIRDEARRLAAAAPPPPPDAPDDPAEMAALAYPDRIALRRPGDAPRYLLSGGKGAVLAEGDPLAGQRMLVVTDLDGQAREARIRAALPISETALRALFPDRLRPETVCQWDRRARRVVARRQERFGALVLADAPWPDASDAALARAALDGVRDLGLPLTPAVTRLIARADRLRRAGEDLPDLGPEALLASAEDWLLPFLGKVRTAADIAALDLLPALQAYLGWDRLARIDALMPPQFTTPLGRKVPIDYDSDPPEIALRLQELFGQTTHPAVAGGRIPLKLTLLSPAQRPIAVTSDLPGFWAGSYAEVRKDMRGQYPKHPWPEDPTEADPTLRAKPRKG
jgi:ATP-dependent helicase HrpB